MVFSKINNSIHKIITTVEKLESTLIDGFCDSPCVSIKLHFQYTHEIFLELMIREDNYFVDGLVMVLMNCYDKNIIQNIKPASTEISDIVRAIVNEQLQSLNKIIADLHGELSQISDENQLLKNKITELEHFVDTSAIFYVASEGKMFGMFRNKKDIVVSLTHKEYRNTEYITSTEPYNSFELHPRYLNFDVDRFKYFIALENITFKECPFENLDFITVTDKLKTIKLIDMHSLKYIKHLSKFSQLEIIIIEGVCNIVDFSSLVGCKNLKELHIPKNVCVDLLPEEIKFKILIA